MRIILLFTVMLSKINEFNHLDGSFPLLAPFDVWA